MLFILPLNALFVERANQASVFRRLFRVMDVRTGVLERNSIKLAGLYNELKNAWDQIPHVRDEASKVAQVRKSHRPVSVFVICPEQPLSSTPPSSGRHERQGKLLILCMLRRRRN